MANSKDPDQTPQNAASDQGLHCLLKLQEDKGQMKQSEVVYNSPIILLSGLWNVLSCTVYWEDLKPNLFFFLIFAVENTKIYP